MYKFILIIFLLTFGCRYQGDSKLQDTIEKLKIKADFHPLDSGLAYTFINDCYLPRLDTLKIGRKLLLYQINAVDFSINLKRSIDDLKAKYRGDTNIINNKFDPPLGLIIDTKKIWNKSRLLNVVLIGHTQIHHSFFEYDIDKKRLDWHKKFGNGFVSISYPMFNNQTNKLYMRECIVKTIGTIDANIEENELWFEKTNKGWKFIQ